MLLEWTILETVARNETNSVSDKATASASDDNSVSASHNDNISASPYFTVSSSQNSSASSSSDDENAFALESDPGTASDNTAFASDDDFSAAEGDTVSASHGGIISVAVDIIRLTTACFCFCCFQFAPPTAKMLLLRSVALRLLPALRLFCFRSRTSSGGSRTPFNRRTDRFSSAIVLRAVRRSSLAHFHARLDTSLGRSLNDQVPLIRLRAFLIAR